MLVYNIFLEHEYMRAAFQVLVLPFRRTAVQYEFAVLKRRDADYWQFVAGGGEVGETPLEAARRETMEEIGIGDELISLDSMSTVPKNHFKAAAAWGKDVYVIPEYCFGVDVGNFEIMLSAEHIELQWATYNQARRLLQWDSNRNALWELNERLAEIQCNIIGSA